MKKRLLTIIVLAITILAVSVSLLSPQTETMNLNVQRMHGSISTALGSPILGDPAALITIVEFGDYQCHQCKNWFDNYKPDLVENYIDTGKANFVFVDLAFLGRDSKTAAQASYCAEEQSKYWEYHDVLYQSQQEIDDGWANKERLRAIAFSLDLDMDLFNSCLDSNKYSNRVQTNIAEATKHRIAATPTFVIVKGDTEQKIVGAQPYLVFENILNSMI